MMKKVIAGYAMNTWETFKIQAKILQLKYKYCKIMQDHFGQSGLHYLVKNVTQKK